MLLRLTLYLTARSLLHSSVLWSLSRLWQYRCPVVRQATWGLICGHSTLVYFKRKTFLIGVICCMYVMHRMISWREDYCTASKKNTWQLPLDVHLLTSQMLADRFYVPRFSSENSALYKSLNYLLFKTVLPLDFWKSINICLVMMNWDNSRTYPCQTWRPSVVSRLSRGRTWLTEPRRQVDVTYWQLETIRGLRLGLRPATTSQCPSDHHSISHFKHFSHPPTLWRPLLPYWYSYKASTLNSSIVSYRIISCARLG